MFRRIKLSGPYWFEPRGAIKGAHPGIGGYEERAGELGGQGSRVRLRMERANEHLQDYGHGSLARIEAYYCDEDGFSILEPCVLRLPSGRGFLAGWSMGKGMACGFDGDIYEDAGEAARAAHHVAERDAEREREYQEEERARIEAEEEQAELDARAAVLDAGEGLI